MSDLLGCVRGLQVAASLSLFGALLYRAAIVPAALDRAPSDAAATLDRRVRNVAIGSLVAALVAAPVWLVLQSAEMIGGGLSEGAADLGLVLRHSHFGAAFLLRVALLLLAALALTRMGRATALRPVALGIAVIASGGSVALEAEIGHAAGMDGAEGATMTVLQAAHLLAAGAWLGGLLPLWLTLSLPLPAASLAVRRFSPLGICCVAILVVTAAGNFWAFIGGLPALLGTPYGQWTLAKTAGFATLLGLAAVNRFRLSPLLSSGAPAAARRLGVSVAVEAALGFAVVLAAGMLSTHPPGRHEQPWWPLPVRLSGEAVQVADLAFEILVAGGIALVGLLLLVAALRQRRLKWVSLVIGLGLIAYAAPSFRLLTVEAFPTTFWRSPTGFAAVSIARGAPLFAAHCAVCHGATGRGDGPAASGIRIAPADLTADHLWDHSDGDLFWWISNGMAEDAMPEFASRLDEASRWNLIDFVHANAAGATAASGTWSRPVRAPGLTAVCPDGGTVGLGDLAGRVVHLVFPAAPGVRTRQLCDAAPRLTAAGATTVFATPASSAGGAGFCTADAPELIEAYALVSGVPAEAMLGAELLIDRGGWLRERWSPGDRPDWGAVETLLQRIEAIRRAPLAAPDPHMHAH